MVHNATKKPLCPSIEVFHRVHRSKFFIESGNDILLQVTVHIDRRVCSFPLPGDPICGPSIFMFNAILRISCSFNLWWLFSTFATTTLEGWGAVIHQMECR